MTKFRWLIATLTMLTLCGAVSAQPTKVYVFGNSLINHASDTEKTTVPYWLGYLAARENRELQLDGRWGFLRNFAEELPPQAQWGFSNVTSAWGRNYRQFADVGYQHIIFNPANFIQYRPAELPYEGDNPTGASPLSAAVDLFQQIPATDIVLYEGWADMGTFGSGFPPRQRQLRRYHAFNVGEYHDWYVEFANSIQQALPETQVTLLPVARILSRAFTEIGLKELDATDLYSDNAPHGTANLYFLASIPVYAHLFGGLPSEDAVPTGLHPLIQEHFAEFLDIIRDEMSFEKAEMTSPQPELKVDVAKVSIERPSEHGNEAPALGYGLDGIADWSTQVPFVDLMKSSRRWVGHLKGQFGGWTDEDLRAGGHLDEYGWPISLPEELTKLETFMLTDFPEEAKRHAGVYRLSWKGEGRVELAGRPRAIRYGEKEIWFRFSPGDGAIGVAVHDTDPMNTGDYIRDISVVREDQIPLFEAGVTFNPDWLDVVNDIRLVRFMDWMFTNGSVAKAWDDRPLVEDYTYAYRGVPLEVMVDLVNQIGADPWFNMPHMADDLYVQKFADYVNKNLRPGLKAHVEYSNEMWNFMFPQTHWAAEQAEALWRENPNGDAWMQYYGHRSAQVAQIWTDRFAEDMSRLSRIVSVHTGWPELEQAALNAPLAVKTRAQKPSEVFDAYAVTGYFGLEYGTDERAPEVLEWIAEGQEAGQGFQLAIERLTADIEHHGLKELTQSLWPYHAGVAAAHDMELIMYEGGTHVVGHGEWTNNDELTDFFNALNYSPEMAAIYQRLLASWDAVGGTVFNAFVDVARPSKWGSWGTRRYLGDDNPRSETLRSYNLHGPKWHTARDKSAFQSGVHSVGTDGPDVMVGSNLSDVLLAGPGDDELLPAGGNNFLHGGEGNDHAVLPGYLEEYQFAAEGARLVATSKSGSTRLFAVETISFSEAPDLILSTSDLF